MALMQTMPAFRLAGVSETGKIVPRARAPVQAAFRSGADLTSVLNIIATERNVVVTAAPGSGKTTVLPQEYLAKMGGLVVQVFPFAHMAAAQHRYAVGKFGADGQVLMLSADMVMPSAGRVFTSAGTLVARWLAAGKPGMEKECVVMHDESHESGFASALMRTFCPVMDGVRCYVQMTATHDLEPARAMETGGQVVDMLYDPSAFADPWSVEDERAPWSALTTHNNILLFEDDPVRAQTLMQAYQLNGFSAFRFHAKQPVDKYLSDVAFIERNRGLSVIIADSTHRSSHTYSVAKNIDSGLVKRVAVVSPGKYHVVSRQLYAAEVQQTRARGARLPGERCEYWRPQYRPLDRVCSLEQTDVEAFVLVCRYLGYRVPAGMPAGVFSEGPVPRDAWEAFSGPTPLACLPAHLLVEPAQFVAPPVSGVGSPVAAPAPVVAERVQTVSVDVPVVATASADVASDVAGQLRGMLKPSPAEGIDFGGYLHVMAPLVSDMACMAFPDGASSVRRAYGSGQHAYVVHSWSEKERAVALNCMVAQHNCSLLELRALARTVGIAREQGGLRDPFCLRQWVTSSMERLSALAADVDFSHKLVTVLATAFSSVAAGQLDFSDEESVLAGELYKGFESLPVVGDAGRAREHAGVSTWARARAAAVAPAEQRSVQSVARKKVAFSPLEYFSGAPPGWLEAARAQKKARSASSASSSSSSSAKKVLESATSANAVYSSVLQGGKGGSSTHFAF